MKRTFIYSIACLLLLAATSTAHAQKRGGGARPAFAEGDNTLAFGLGLGPAYNVYLNNANRIPAFIAYFDHGLIGNVGPGTIGLGGIVGFQAGRFTYNNNRRYTETNFWLGIRGTYHLTILKDRNNKFDPYAGLAVGIHSETWDDDFYGTSNSSVGPYVGPFVGAKYNFVPSFGAWTELGYDIAFFKIGLHFNF